MSTTRVGVLAAAVLALTAAPAVAQERSAAERERDVARTTQRLERDNARSIVRVTATTRPMRVPQLLLPGLRLAPPRAGSEQIDATGFMVSRDGHIATTLELLRNVAQLEVLFSDGTLRDADLVGVDDAFQIAVLRSARQQDPTPLVDVARDVGARGTLGWAFASSDGRAQVDVARIQPATCRDTTYDRYLYATRSLEPGAAGGPLLSAAGTLLGMAVGEIRGRSNAASHMPDDRVGPLTLFVRGKDVKDAAQAIIEEGRVRRPMIGVMLDGRTSRVDQLLPNGPAERAGLREGDRLTRVGGSAVRHFADITRELLRRRPGDRIEIEYERGDERIQGEITVTERELPPLPEVPPLEGALLELSIDEPEADDGRLVRFLLIDGESRLHRAGVRVGDLLVSVDGRPVTRFLQRHRIRPSEAPPEELVISRDGKQFTIVLDE